jgi:hypothetical protein
MVLYGKYGLFSMISIEIQEKSADETRGKESKKKKTEVTNTF